MGGVGGICFIIFNLFSQKFRLLACLEPPKKFSVVVSKMTLVFCFGSKPKLCSFDLDLDQAEQLGLPVQTKCVHFPWAVQVELS